MESSIKMIELVRVSPDLIESANDVVSIEEPLEIQVVSGVGREIQSVSVTMRTPGHDHELAIGFLFTEGIIRAPEELTGVESPANNVIRVGLDPALEVNTQSLTRNFYTTSSCGVCGKASIDAIKIESRILVDNFVVDAHLLQRLPLALQESQQNFNKTGGLHASALFSEEGTLILVREDVGRHNALDKLIGSRVLQNELPLSNMILLVSGRASFELVQKASIAGIPMMIAIGAPSSLAVELAEEKGITLIGFFKSDRFNIYSHKHRIQTHA